MELGDRVGPRPPADDEFCRRWAADLYPGWRGVLLDGRADSP